MEVQEDIVMLMVKWDSQEEAQVAAVAEARDPVMAMICVRLVVTMQAMGD